MFGIGMPELLLILAVALIVLGPKRLPELARSLGKGLAEFKKSTEELKGSLDIGEDFKDIQKDLSTMVDPSHYLNISESPPPAPDHKTEKDESKPVSETPPSSFPKASEPPAPADKTEEDESKPVVEIPTSSFPKASDV